MPKCSCQEKQAREAQSDAQAFSLFVAQVAGKQTQDQVSTTLKVGCSAAWETRPAGFSGEGICTAGDVQEMPQSPSHGISGSSSLSFPTHISAACSCACQKLFLSPGLLPLHVHTYNLTCCVLRSALQTPPGSRALPRGISVCAEAKDQLKEDLMRTGVSVPSPERRINFHLTLPTQSTKSVKLKV